MADFDLNAALEEAVNPPPGSDLMAIMEALHPMSFNLMEGLLELQPMNEASEELFYKDFTHVPAVQS